MNAAQFDEAVEALLVARNPRGMARLRAALQPGYYRRAAAILHRAQRVLIGTGFPVAGTFETDGPAGAIALYKALEGGGAQCWLACAPPLAAAIDSDFRVLTLCARTADEAAREASRQLSAIDPQAVLSIERPGRAADGRYYNMRGEDISAGCGIFDSYVECANCPTVGIGDGGNEIGMGKLHAVISAELDITPSVTACDELLVADVSNWGAYGLIAYLGLWQQRDLLAELQPLAILEYLSQRGSVDGVSRENTLSEDGLPAAVGEQLVAQLRTLQRRHREHTEHCN